MLRVGSFIYLPSSVRSAARNWFAPSNRHNNFGFRLARTYK
jgi:formylglycine-generating enzyme required for sulfatase activity